jgi:hypothetical protein
MKQPNNQIPTGVALEKVSGVYQAKSTTAIKQGTDLGIVFMVDERFPDNVIRIGLGGFLQDTKLPNCRLVTTDVKGVYRLRTETFIHNGDALTVDYTPFLATVNKLVQESKDNVTEETPESTKPEPDTSNDAAVGVKPTGILQPTLTQQIKKLYQETTPQVPYNVLVALPELVIDSDKKIQFCDSGDRLSTQETIEVLDTLRELV